MARKGKNRSDWVQAGQRLLIEGGIEAVKLHCLTRVLDVSTGSFYHHFQNFDDYLGALAEFYGTEQAQLVFDRARQRVGDDPTLILYEGAFLHAKESMRLLNIAMRAWAHSDDRAAAAVKRHDKTMMRNLDELFLALGFDDLAARSRTLIMMGLASVDIDQSDMKPSFQDRWLHIRDLITATAQSATPTDW